MLHPYECPECGCFHLSKMDRAKAVRLNLNAKVKMPDPLPESSPKADPFAEESALLKADRANFVRRIGDEYLWLVKTKDGSVRMVKTGTGKKRKIRSVEEPSEEAREMYPSLFKQTA